MQATDLEKAILEWFSIHQPSVRAQIADSQIESREHTGAGFYVFLSPREGREWDRPPVSGPMIEAAELDAGGGSLLWLSDGEPHCLEIYAFGSEFPDVLGAFRLSGDHSV